MQKFREIVAFINGAKVIEPSINYSEYIPLDLSVFNENLKNYKLENASDYELFIQSQLDEKQAKIAYGGYLEKRNLYKRSTVFNSENADERDIHIGLDLWINKQASIHAVLDGVIHSFQNNTALGDYGPTIILEHEYNNVLFYSLYGHLSEESLQEKEIGQKVIKGEQIATLGLPPINGDYAPHLHFQIIMNMEGKTGDYPGVSSENNLNFYKNNCPNPNELLNIY
ncbi:peptidoglycan DD-metalloendopeptidase family protein [Flavobacterium dankookense]|uniref:Peptidase M23-like protein n=1 Tax=Flavobacterium dankookense TaxID=706186 RepID=A0A4R6Q6P8_9FLAO|nr:peptidoglycan DD-metalloendopeptidase family protein [Flavobacterium dankookense]TDP58164.1 peptidase M23-like protein [Flavobacterium dankookense]